MRKTMIAAATAAFLAISGPGAFAAGGHDGHDHDDHGTKAGKPAPGKAVPKKAAPKKEAAGHDAHEEEKGHEGHGHGEAEGSDLDRSIRELWAAQCEHDMATHKCDECRYEVGVVRVPASLLGGDGKPGLVSVVRPERTSFSAGRSFPGEVQLSGGRTMHVSSPLEGTVRSVAVDVGAQVKPGDVLIEIDSPEVAEAKGELLKKAAASELAKRNAEREARLFEKKISAEVEVQEAMARAAEADIDLANARARLLRLGVPEADLAAVDRRNPESLGGRLVVRAAQAGTVLERHATAGERVEAGKELLLVSDLSEVLVLANLRPEELPALARKGGGRGTFPAEVRGPGGKRYPGTLEILSGSVDERTRMLRARVAVSNPDGVLRPGMFVTVDVRLPGGGSALTLPRSAVLRDAGRSFVFVHKEGDFWIRRPVKVGRSAGDRVEITGGLRADQKVVADGAFLLKSDVLRGKMGAGCAD